MGLIGTNQPSASSLASPTACPLPPALLLQRIGLHTGPVVTGLIGTKLPKFSVFGEYGGAKAGARGAGPQH